MPPLVAKVPSNSDKFEAGKLNYRDLYSLEARLNYLQCSALSELRMQQWLARVSPNACIGSYTFPVNNRMPLITELVALEIRCETKLRSTPNCEPNRGRTIRSPIRIIIPL